MPAEDRSALVLDLDHRRRRIRVVGELDLATGPALAEAFRTLTGTAPMTDVTVDLTALSFLDVAGARALLAVEAEVTRAGAELQVVGSRGAADQLFRLLSQDSLVRSTPAPA